MWNSCRVRCRCQVCPAFPSVGFVPGHKVSGSAAPRQAPCSLSIPCGPPDVGGGSALWSGSFSLSGPRATLLWVPEGNDHPSSRSIFPGFQVHIQRSLKLNGISVSFQKCPPTAFLLHQARQGLKALFLQEPRH